jgi:hypothetical protein
MLRCPICESGIPLARLVEARAPGINLHPESMRFRLKCPACGETIGLARSTTRIFFAFWLCPLPLLAWLAHELGFAQALFVLALPGAWLLLFPFYWLARVQLVSFRSP